MILSSQTTYTKTSFSVSLPPQCRSQAVVCVSTPRMYPRSGYFLVSSKIISGKDARKKSMKYEDKIGSYFRKGHRECFRSQM